MRPASAFPSDFDDDHVGHLRRPAAGFEQCDRFGIPPSARHYNYRRIDLEPGADPVTTPVVYLYLDRLSLWWNRMHKRSWRGWLRRRHSDDRADEIFNETMTPLLKTETRMMLVALACPVLFAGCSFAPKYAKPSVQTPAAFKELTPAQFKETDAGKPPSQRTTRFAANGGKCLADTNLNALEEQVNISNQTVAAAFANFLSARAVIKQTRSGFFPTVGVNPSVTRLRTASINSPMTRLTANTRCRSTLRGPDFWGSIRIPTGPTNSKRKRRWPFWKTHG